VSVILAAHDCPGVPALVAAWQEQLRRIGNTFEVILCGVPVRSDVADTITVSCEPPSGLGAALRAGFAASAHPLVLIVVPEYAFRPHELRAVLKAIDAADVVAGVRPGHSRPVWLERFRRFLATAARIVVGIEPTPPTAWYGWARWRRRLRWRLAFGLRLQDPDSGLLLLRREILERCPLQSTGRFALVELLAKANFAGAMIVEVPLSKAGDLPVRATPFEEQAADQGLVFRRPKFNAPTRVAHEPAEVPRDSAPGMKNA